MTNYYTDSYKTYSKEPMRKRVTRLMKKYVVIDSGQLIVGCIGLIFIMI